MIDRKELVELLPRLRRYARVLTRDVDRADDLTQDTVERAIAREHSFRDGEGLRAWLFSIMHNLHVDRLRAKDPIDWSLDADELPEPASQPCGDPHTLRDMRAALASLPEDYREALLLVAVEGLRYHEAANALGVPIGTIMSRLARGRERLGELLGERVPAFGAGVAR